MSLWAVFDVSKHLPFQVCSLFAVQDVQDVSPQLVNPATVPAASTPPLWTHKPSFFLKLSWSLLYHNNK